MASVGPFVNSALRNKRYIRLLKLLSPADDSLFVRIQTMITSLDDPESIMYSALSYTWENALYVSHDPSMPKSAPFLYKIECNGKLLMVGENLYYELIRLRDVALTDWYWIDAICINQGDLAERSIQVIPSFQRPQWRQLIYSRKLTNLGANDGRDLRHSKVCHCLGRRSR